ncbi:MAG: hypothetical protein HYZ52_01295, partial [Candidatus Omnitrophica bacterium]|nr:hypothetical protein [Candidatus Omnitrophota bacterium]
LSKMKPGDVPAVDAIWEIARAVVDARPEDAATLSVAWQWLSGLKVPPQVLWRMINRHAKISLILRYLLVPVVSVKRKLAQEFLTRQYTAFTA